MIRFHRAAIDLLPTLPVYSPKNAKIIAERERQLHRSLPASVREWYSLEGSVDLLREYSNCDEPVPLNRLGAPAQDWYGSGPRDFIRDNLLWIMTENQGVCNWAVRLDGADDPPVVVAVDSAPHETWRPLTATFSEFVFCQIWDHPQSVLSCGAQEIGLATADLDYLHQQFRAGPKTSGWPGSFNYRFHSANGSLLIWFADHHGADWFLFSHGEEQMVRLLESVWTCGNLAKSLYAGDEAAARALDRVRARNT